MVAIGGSITAGMHLPGGLQDAYHTHLRRALFAGLPSPSSVHSHGMRGADICNLAYRPDVLRKWGTSKDIIILETNINSASVKNMINGRSVKCLESVVRILLEASSSSAAEHETGAAIIFLDFPKCGDGRERRGIGIAARQPPSPGALPAMVTSANAIFPRPWIACGSGGGGGGSRNLTHTAIVQGMFEKGSSARNRDYATAGYATAGIGASSRTRLHRCSVQGLDDVLLSEKFVAEFLGATMMHQLVAECFGLAEASFLAMVRGNVGDG